MSFLNRTYLRKAKNSAGANKKIRTIVLNQADNFFIENSKTFNLEIQKILAAFKLPNFYKEAVSSPEKTPISDKKLEQVFENLRHLFADGNSFILPSFYELIFYLQKINKKFSLLIRTFGNDHSTVNQELQ